MEQISISENKKENLFTYHLFTDGKGFFSVQEGNKIVYEDKPNIHYRLLLDTKFLSAEIDERFLAEWIIELQDLNIINEDFTI